MTTDVGWPTHTPGHRALQETAKEKKTATGDGEEDMAAATEDGEEDASTTARVFEVSRSPHRWA
jgi:hypothetical protein